MGKRSTAGRNRRARRKQRAEAAARFGAQAERLAEIQRDWSERAQRKALETDTELGIPPTGAGDDPRPGGE